MTGYAYEFDKKRAGRTNYDREEYETLHEALVLLETKLISWNEIAMKNGAFEAPYTREVRDLRRMIEWGAEELSNKDRLSVFIDSISIGSVRYIKAALLHAAWHHEREISQKAMPSWPSAVAEATRGRVRRYHQLAEEIEFPPAAILNELRPEYQITSPQPNVEPIWNAFVCHASEDKDSFVRPLADALRALDIRVWYDEFTLTVGDSLRRSIDRGLAWSRFGIVVLSTKFFEKEWPQKELDGLMAREVDGKKIILPVWHGIDAERIRQFSPMLADRVGISTAVGIPAVVNALITAMKV